MNEHKEGRKYQVEIQIVSLEVLQSLVDCLLHMVGMMVCVPQLACDLKYSQYSNYIQVASDSLTKIWSLGTPDFFQPFPTSFSFK